MDPACLKLLGGMGTAVLGLAGFVLKLYLDLKETRRDLTSCQNARAEAAEEHARELGVLKSMIEKKGGKK